MKTQIYPKKMPILAMTSLILAFFASTLAQAAVMEEVSYDDLVNQLSQKRQSIATPDTDPFDSIKIHAGFGLIGSANKVNVEGDNATKWQSGFQISLGVDLFSPHWGAEGDVRNFGQARSGTETRSLREYDLKFFHRNHFSQTAGYRVGAGVGTRYLKIDDEVNGVFIQDNTPTAVLFGGIDAYASKGLSFGIEAGWRNSMINATADRNAMDLTLRLDTYF